MPLSEYEQRVLEQMERALTSDDPRLANTFHAPRRRSVLRYVLAGAGVVGGLLLLVLGAATSQTWLGVVGFVLMFAGVVLVFQSPRGARKGPVGTVGADGRVRPSAPKKQAARQPFLSRLEERWERRREQGGR
ncbi:DUF3040 domain-containing protein [Cellulosimicrobium sp. CUA-896]|uniref:DUF3040 domain-containing protein n=1 Tax=Cellulosimicrobium sp. CUA-896 TaxID=1517881 RepID=UPI0009695FC5|nr:DUF3040 domain-containing protein [Cellulosimicrobium sp. CUA-896]OLT46850.1 hypothetical protein BJF88_04045 [Cellulosimicrobium sp. CUA-896]